MAYEALYTRGRPKNFAQLVGQEHISNALTRAVISNRLSHAYLLVGTRGTGKTSTARLLAKAMNCEKVLAGQVSAAKDIPCNECASCKSIDSSPDNVEFDAASNRSVDDVARLLSTAYMSPLKSRVKTFIIDEIHMLSNEAINSILKLIEEPPPNVAFFLATTEINKVPMTIRSRCQVLNFRLIPQETISPYLIKMATTLNIELENDAAKKIARLAEGSMRDALTYLDQCYAMADKKITLADVNETLGLVSDADLDEIISAVQSHSRAEVGRAINHAFRSGLSSISIAEALITRLRDIEFENLRGDISDLDNFVDAVRKAILEMQGSGVPDIILEMTLMKIAAPKIISAVVAQPIAQPKPAPPPKIEVPKTETVEPPVEKAETKTEPAKIFTGNFDADKNIFYDIVKNSNQLTVPLQSAINSSVVTEISNGLIKLAFTKSSQAKAFNGNDKTKLENILTQKLGQSVTIETIVNTYLPNPNLDRINTQHRAFVDKAMKTFGADDFK